MPDNGYDCPCDRSHNPNAALRSSLLTSLPPREFLIPNALTIPLADSALPFVSFSIKIDIAFH